MVQGAKSMWQQRSTYDKVLTVIESRGKVYV